MKVNVIRADNPDVVMKMSLNGFQDQNTVDFFRNQYQGFMERLGPHAEQFVNNVKSVYNYITDNAVVNAAKRALTRVDNVAMNDRLIQYVNSETIHNPGLTMRRHVMALPELYDMYNNNLCAGYDDEWENRDQGIKPEWRRDYLNVIDGEVGDEYTIFAESDNPLSTRERFIIKNAWDTAKELMAVGIDPTNYNTDGEL